MLGTFSLEHTNFINSGLTWMGSKGNRRSSRQAKKSVPGSLKGCRELFNENLKTVDMPVCESEKLGVSVLGCRFKEKAEHVPIKKRRFVCKSPSPPPRASSPLSEKKNMLLRIKSGLIDCTASTNDLCPIVGKDCDVDETNSEKVKVQVDDDKDFSGISILADAAFSKAFGGEDDYVEDGSGIEESFDRSTNNESLSLLKGLSKEDLNSAEILAEGTGSCVSALPAEDSAVSMRTGNTSAIVLLHKNNMEETCVPNHPLASKDLLTSKDEGTIRQQGLSSRDDRLHWDLNRAMDSWDHLSEFQVADSNTSVSDGIAEDVDHGKQNFEGYELPSDLGDSKTDAVQELLPSASREMSHERKQSNIEDDKPSVSANFKRYNFVEENLLSSELDHAVKVDEFEGKQPLHSQERIRTGAGSVFVPAEDAKKLSVSINEDQSTSNHTVSFGCAIVNDVSSIHGVFSLYSCADNNVISKSNNHKGSCAADANMLTSIGSQVEKQEVGCLVPLSGSTTVGGGGGLNKAVADVKEIPGLLDGTSTPRDIAVLDVGQRSKTCFDNATENKSCSAAQGSEVPISTAPVEDPPAMAVDLDEHHDEASVHCSTETDTLVHISGEEPPTKLVEKSTEMLLAPLVRSSHDLYRSNWGDLVDSSDRMTLEEPLDDNYSDVSHGHASLKSSELEVDYDSQYEDGEVRESIVANWEEDDGEDMEVEHVDYGSDNANNFGCEGEKTMKHTQETNFQPSISGSAGSGNGRQLKGKEGRNHVESSVRAGPGRVNRDDIGSEVKIEKPSLSADSIMKISGQDPRTFSDSMIVGDGSCRKNLTDDSMDVTATEGTKMRMVVSREFKRELRSHVEGQALQDAYFKKGKTYMQGSSDTDNTYQRYERVSGYVEFFDRVRYTHHSHARGEEGSRWINSVDCNRGLKRYRSPHYHVPASFRRPGPEHGCIGRQKMDVSSRDVHQRLARSGSPGDDRGEAYHLRLGFRPSRELSPGRCMILGRGRSRRYDSRLDGRGLRGRYRGTLIDDCSVTSSLNHSHSSVKKDRSFSRIERRGEDFAWKSHSKSPPRSRIRSPDSGNPSSGCRSKSPSVRSEVRMRRGRSHHQRSGFVADRMLGFRTLHRNHSSPPHNSRWIDDWKDGTVHFRGQARFGPRDERFEFLDTPRNYRSIHTGRLLDAEGIGRGRPRSGGSGNNREKHSHRFRMVPPKRYDVGGPVKQFRYNVDEGSIKGRNSRYVDGANFYGRGSPKQFGRGIESLIVDGRRRFIEERGPFMHQRDGKHNTNPKSSETRESDDEKVSMKRAS